MNRANILNVFEQLIEESYFHCEWAIEWQERENEIELVFQMNLENPNNLSFKDNYDNISHQTELVYNVKIMIYKDGYKRFSDKDYIVSIPVNSERGIDYGKCLVIVKYLKKLTSSVDVKWLDFLSETDVEEFSLKWKWSDFEAIQNRLIESNRYSKTPIYFPHHEDIN